MFPRCLITASCNVRRALTYELIAVMRPPVRRCQTAVGNTCISAFTWPRSEGLNGCLPKLLCAVCVKGGVLKRDRSAALILVFFFSVCAENTVRLLYNAVACERKNGSTLLRCKLRRWFTRHGFRLVWPRRPGSFWSESSTNCTIVLEWPQRFNDIQYTW